MKEDSATKPRRFSAYIANHGDNKMCPLFWYNEEHCNLIISNLKSSWTRMPNPFVFFHSMAFQDTKRGTSWGFCTHVAGRGTEPSGIAGIVWQVWFFWDCYFWYELQQMARIKLTDGKLVVQLLSKREIPCLPHSDTIPKFSSAAH